MEREQDEQEYENDIMAEVSELQVETEEDYQKKMSEYRRRHEEWKSWKRKQVLLHAVVCILIGSCHVTR